MFQFYKHLEIICYFEPIGKGVLNVPVYFLERFVNKRDISVVSKV